MNQLAVLLFVIVAIALRAIDSRNKRGGSLPPVAQPPWPHAPQPQGSPKSASDRPFVQETDKHRPAPREAHAHAPQTHDRHAPAPAHTESRPRTDRSPHQIAERELTTAGELNAPVGSALARLQASIEERRLALERRHAKGVSIRSADRGPSA
ncbi:MAG: hypothetical protein ABIU54_11250 [Candidatus Eisenbacteria bacterium]